MIIVDGLPQTEAKLRWLSMTPWIGARFQTHISIPGGEGIGVTYDRGSDNRVATLTGIVSWEGDGENFLNRIGGKILTIKRYGTEEEIGVRAISSSPSVTDYQGATIRFTMTLTEVEGDEA